MNWQQIATDLQSKFHSDNGVAMRVGCCKKTIMDMRNGKTKDPYYSIGSKLVDLHRRYCSD